MYCKAKYGKIHILSACAIMKKEIDLKNLEMSKIIAFSPKWVR